ncbi:MAG: hypothetical protein IJ559_09295 [Prevotella sp.]|nr:hypothetical protein [Prevotella sp.]
MPMRHVARLAKASCALAFFFFQVTACTDDESGGGITLSSSSAIELYPVVNQKGTVSFSAPSSWTATCSANWLYISPRQGEAGDNTITVMTTSTNQTKATRSAQLMITSRGTQKSVTVVQSGKYALFLQDEIFQGPEGGTLTIPFVSNLEESDNPQVSYSAVDWISWADQSRLTRSEWNGHLPAIYLEPNLTTETRTAVFALMMASASGEWLGLDTCFVHQQGLPVNYESTDYSSDGVVTVLQQATVGRGINVVIMGDGFADCDIADGTYMQVMQQTLDNMFSEEPVKSLRDYFTVYAVTAVSQNHGVGADYSTVFSTVPSLTESGISCDEDKIEEYLSKVPGVNIQNMLAVVILNSHAHNGVTYWYSDQNHQPVQYALAMCPVIENLESETFRQVLTHEVIGHGLAKLGDEYGYATQGTATDEIVSRVSSMHDYGWLLNVDGSNDAASVVWSRFIGDSQFANENIGVFEGGYTYAGGIFRPTEESMMNSNRSPFNAPSRQAIYNKVMELGEGRTDVSYEEFVAFDAVHKPTVWDYTVTRSRQSSGWRPAPPVLKQLR